MKKSIATYLVLFICIGIAASAMVIGGVGRDKKTRNLTPVEKIVPNRLTNLSLRAPKARVVSPNRPLGTVEVNVWKNVVPGWTDGIEVFHNAGGDPWAITDCTVSFIEDVAYANLVFYFDDLNYALGTSEFHCSLKAEKLTVDTARVVVAQGVESGEQGLLTGAVELYKLERNVTDMTAQLDNIGMPFIQVVADFAPNRGYQHVVVLQFQHVNAGATFTLDGFTFTQQQYEAYRTVDLSECPVDFGEKADCALQLDENTWLGLQENWKDVCLVGISTTADTLVLPREPIITANNEDGATLTYFGDYNTFDWSLAPNLRCLDMTGIRYIYSNFNGSPVTDIYINSNVYCSDYIRTDGVPLYTHAPMGARESLQSAYRYTDYGCELLVGDEVPGMPAMPNSTYRYALGDGDYIGLNAVEGRLTVREIATQKEVLTIPDVAGWGSRDNLYPITQVGESRYIYDLTNQAPNLHGLYLPQNLSHLYVYDGWDNKINEYHMAGPVPVYDYAPNNEKVTVYVLNKDYYDAYASAWPNCNLQPEGWEFDWTVVNVAKPGEFAQTYLEANNSDWGAARNLKVVGTLNSIDLGNLKNLTRLGKLDLTETDITALPNSFMSSKATLTSVSLPATIHTIGGSAFYNCTNLKEVLVADGGAVKVVEGGAFQSASKLTAFDLSQVVNIRYSAFLACSAYAPTGAPAAVLIESQAFANTAITVVEEDFFNSAIKTVPSDCFRNCAKLTSVSLPDCITSIESSAFESCSQLANLKLPADLVNIGSDAFYGTGLTEVMLPANLETLGSGAFSRCYNINKVTCAASIPPTANGSVLPNVDLTNVPLYVPSFAVDNYRLANYWSAFYIMKPLMTPIERIKVTYPISLNFSEADNEVLQNNPDLIMTYVNNSKVGELTINGNGTMSAGVIDYDVSLISRNDYYSSSNTYKYPTLINNAEKMRTDSLSVHMEIPNTSTWNFITLPYDVNVKDIIPSPNTYWVIRQYDAAARAEGRSGSTWVNLTADDVLEAGKGYIMNATYSSPDGNYKNPQLTFPSRNTVTKNNIFRSTDVIVPLEEHVSEFAQNRSWNQVGNPYPAFYNMSALKDNAGEQFTAPITLWRGTSYTAYSPVDDQIYLKPFESFFMQRPLDKAEVTFTAEGRMHNSEARSLTQNGSTPGAKAPARIEDRQVFNFNIAVDELTNRTRIVLNEDARADYEVGRDAAKFFETQNGAPLIYVSADQSYEISERPLADGSATLGVQLGKEGLYTVSLTGNYLPEWKVMLTDLETGRTVDLVRESYTFSGNVSANAKRFEVKFDAGGITGLTELSTLDAEAQVSVTDLDGRRLYTGKLRNFRPQTMGVHLIRTAERTYKVLLER